MDAKLVVVGGEARVTEIELNLPLTVGRGRNSGLALPHPLVSRKHCEIYEEEGKIVVNDLGSLNGTFVGDRRINEPTFLMPGELLTIGTVTFRAVYQTPRAGDLEQPEEESTTTELPGDDLTIDVEEATKPAPVPETADTGKVADLEPNKVEVEEVELADSAEFDAEDDSEEVAEEVAEAADSGELVAESASLESDAGLDDDDEIAALDEIEEVVDVGDASELDEIEPIEEVEDVDVAEIDEVESMDDADPIDVDATIPAPQTPSKPQPGALDTSETTDRRAQPNHKRPASASKSSSAAVAEELDDVEMIDEEEAASVDDISAADHETKKVESPSELDTEAVEAEEDDDDLQAFLRGLG